MSVRVGVAVMVGVALKVGLIIGVVVGVLDGVGVGVGVQVVVPVGVAATVVGMDAIFIEGRMTTGIPIAIRMETASIASPHPGINNRSVCSS